ncbi:MAG: DNA polymerase III subunit gamma/tau [Peptococcaceae bacterium MAG4]|jgi:DNA polymerase-3 subunit gamma/tau|nr:DNA polymerase III subunit gamma/tau [Peptococcaceae bacterium MAG4]NLW38382.1 DNA polymerase III subunit gamma/tau [Peptococcaceae bacterium]
MAYLALYREWRPRTFGEIIGQEHITRTLQNAVKAGRVGHAYLFCGTRGTGKTTTAKVLAKALNCSRLEGAEPCNSCDSCVAINEGMSVDVIEIDAASNRGIDEIRDLREKVKFAPSGGRFRVYIIDEVHMLTNEAFNALLKTLEEPPRHVVFILATTEPHKVPLTILSRCQRFDFKRIVPADIIRRLKEVAAGAHLEVEEEALRLIARAAEGGLRDALSILDQGAAFGGMKITAGDVHKLLGTVRTEALAKMAGYLAAGDAGAALRLVNELAGEGKDLRLFAREMASYLRALLLDKISPGAAAEEAWADAAGMTALAADFTEERLLYTVQVITAAEQDMKMSTLPGIVLELALVKACRNLGAGDISALEARLSALEDKVNAALAGGALCPGTPAVPETRPAGGTLPAAGGEVETRGRRPQRGENPDAGLKKTVTGGQVHIPPGEGTGRAGRKPRPGEPDTASAVPGEESSGVTLKQVREAWSALLETLKNERLPLYHNYAGVVPLAVKGQILVLGFPRENELAREMAEQPENKKYLEALLGKSFGGKWQAVFKSYEGKPSFPEPKQNPREPVAEVAKRFGGKEVVLEGEPMDKLF